MLYNSTRLVLVSGTLGLDFAITLSILLLAKNSLCLDTTAYSLNKRSSIQYIILVYSIIVYIFVSLVSLLRSHLLLNC